MDVRIGVTDNPREIIIQLADDADRDEVKAAIDAALTGTAPTLWLIDEKGKEVGVSSAKVAFVELGPDGANPIGFG